MNNKKKNSNDLTLNNTKKMSVQKKMFVFFVVFFVANIFINIVLSAASGGDSWKQMLFHNGNSTDLYMDFFNSIRDGGSEDVYSARNNIYPPFCILIFRFFSKLINPSLVSTSFGQRFQLQLDQLCMMIYIIFAIVCVLSLARLIESYGYRYSSGKNKLRANILSFMMIVSYPVMFCLERGNILILSVVFAMFFIFFKDSDNKFIKELSYISLAMSAGIKIYPAVFGLTLIIEKKYKEALRLLFYGFIIVVFPFVFFIDFNSLSASVTPYISSLLSIDKLVIVNEETSSVLMKILQNLVKFATTKKTSLNFSSVSIQNFIFFFDRDNTSLANIVCVITEFFALFCAFFSKKEWQKIFLLTYLMLNIPSASNSYALSFIIIPFCMFMFANKKYVKRDWLYLICYSLLLTPLPTFWYFYQDSAKDFFESLNLKYNSLLNQDIATVVFQFMFFIIVFEVINSVLNGIKKKKKNKNAIQKIHEYPDAAVNETAEDNAA